MNTRIALSVLMLGVGGASTLLAQDRGIFSATGEMTTARMGHTATLLQNGKVLIAGGWQSVPGGQHCTGSLHIRSYFLDCVLLLNSAELYDPSTGTFTATGSLNKTGLFHTATLLPDGKVLINWGASAELYDPRTEAFSTIDGITSGGNTATLLNNGKVLFTGFPPDLYDPAEGTLVAAGAYAGTHGTLEAAALLPSGRVLIVGNAGCCDDFGRTELYDPATGTFSLTAPIFTDSSSSMRTTLLLNGNALVDDGDNAGVYDPSNGSLTVNGNLTTPRQDHTATLLPDGTVLIAGGDFAAGNRAEIYRPGSASFSPIGDMTIPRFLHTATLLPDGRVLVAGGLPYTTTTTSSAELYAPPTLSLAPKLLSLSGDGTGPAAIQHAGTYQVVSSDNPAVSGEALIIYCTGLTDGSVIPPQLSIGGRIADVLWFGNASGYAGLNQINARVPTGIAPGSALPVRLNYIGRPSNEVSVAVR
jgi:hypothetical protein